MLGSSWMPGLSLQCEKPGYTYRMLNIYKFYPLSNKIYECQILYVVQHFCYMNI